MNEQLLRQRAQLEPLCGQLAHALEVPQVRLAHFALLPEQLAHAMPGLIAPVVTWQQVRDAYCDVDQSYFLGMLDEALSRYDRLVSLGTGNHQGFATAGTLVQQWLAGTTPWQFAGARGGLVGQRVQRAIATGSWRSMSLAVRRDPLPGRVNWFGVDELVEALHAAGQLEAGEDPDSDSSPQA